ncbi:MAG: T9SS type A sorting domain-containing protein, partial [Chitinophagaceae bacterium]
CKDVKVLVCHRNFGSGSGYSNEICISRNAVKAHLAHGDRLGSCGSTCHHGRKDHGNKDHNHGDKHCDDDDNDDNDDDDDGDDDDHVTRVADGSIVETASLTEVRVQPNPSQGQFELFFKAPGATEVIITNTNGTIVDKILIQVGIQGQSVRFNLSRQKAGMYLIRIISKQGIQIRKIIIQK